MMGFSKHNNGSIENNQNISLQDEKSQNKSDEKYRI
jgi:hypothetical protein